MYTDDSLYSNYCILSHHVLIYSAKRTKRTVLTLLFETTFFTLLFLYFLSLLLSLILLIVIVTINERACQRDRCPPFEGGVTKASLHSFSDVSQG